MTSRLETVSNATSERLATVYISLDSLNKRIQQREFYRYTNKPMTNYDQSRKIIDNDIRGRLIDMRTAMTLLLEDLDRLRDPVQGESQ